MSNALVVLMTAGSSDEARVIQAVLRAAGIPAVIEGDSLMDEWAVSQKIMGRIGSEVKVPASAVAEAERVLEEAHAAGIELSQLPEDSDDDPAGDGDG